MQWKQFERKVLEYVELNHVHSSIQRHCRTVIEFKGAGDALRFLFTKKNWLRVIHSDS